MPNENHAELAGQSIMFRFPGPAFTPQAREVFLRIRPAGVLFFADNLTSRDQVVDLTGQLQATARAEGMPPLFIAADQEGGVVSRMPPDMITTPGGMAIGHLPDEDIEAISRITAEQLHSVGINLNFSPTVDINSNPANPVIRTRSFAETPDVVTRAALAYLKGHLDAGVIPTLKHFPGHGDTHVDSHLGLPVVAKPYDHLLTMELAPFRAAINAGAPAVMSAHIVFSELDGLPATLSHTILTRLLRGVLGFRGVIFTDSMSMNAITDRFGHADSTVMAKAAGVDVLESNETPDLILARHQALVQALNDGRLPVEAFEATRQRLDDLRKRFRIGTIPDGVGDAERWRADAKAIARRSIRIVRGALPPADAPMVVIDFQRRRASEAEDPYNRAGIVRQLETRRPGTTVITLPEEPTDDQIATAIETASATSALVLLTRDAPTSPVQAEIANRIAAAAGDARIIHVALRGPYDDGIIQRADTVVCTYGDPALTLESLVDVLSEGRST